MRKYFYLLIVSAIIFVLPLNGQELNLQFMRHTLQGNSIHPGMIPKGSIVVGLPNIYNDLFVTDITYKDVVQTLPDGRTVLSLNDIVNQLENENFIREIPEIKTLSLGFRFKNLFINIGHRIRGNAFINYPKELVQFIAEGNAPFIGQTIEIGPDFQISAFHETSLGLAYQINDIVSVGGRVKLLNGVFDLSTTRTSLQLFTDPEIYQTTLNADFVFNSSSWLQYDGFDDFEFNDNLEGLINDNFLAANASIGFDLGVYFNLDKFDLAISVLDLGNLSWEEEVFNYSIQDEYDYNGLNVTDALFDDDVDIILQDTLREIYQAAETQASYTSPLGTKAYVSGTYKINDRFRAGAVGYVEVFRDEFFSALGLNIQGQFGKVLNAGFLYAFRNKRLDNLGLNIGLNFGGLELYGATDNLLTALNLENANSANIRLGANIVFGKNKVSKLDKDPDNISNQDEFFNQQ